MAYNSTEAYLDIVDELSDTPYNIPPDMIDSLLGYLKSIYRSDLENIYSAPMLWIGMYISLASLVCILAMVADLLHGLRSRKLWFPCRYFRINAAFISVISIAMKLPVDLSGNMPGNVDQAGKLGSMAFMCTMMANLLPCLATMDNNELSSNITALGILVITLAVNVCIQIGTGVVSYGEDERVLTYIAPKFADDSLGARKHRNTIIASIYVALLLVLLIIHVCSCLAILKSKRIIEAKYQQCHQRALKDLQPSSGELLTAEKLENHVINHWIMAGSGNPQFITASFRTTSASGVICVLVTVLHTLTMYWTIDAIFSKDCGSDYGWSMIVILIVQFIGVVIGTIAPLFRCFTTLSFKVTSEIILRHLKVFEVESYWTSKLYDWKRASIKLPFRSPGSRQKLERATENLKRLILRLCLEFQEGVVVLCKIISLIPFVLICVFYCLHCLKKWLLIKWLGKNTENSDPNKDLYPYVLHLEDEMQLAERTLKGLSKSVKRLIRKGEKRQRYNFNLITMIREKSTPGFHGVAKFDHIDYHRVPSLLSTIQHHDCWSLPVVTLTTIAVSLRENEVDNLMKSEVDNLMKSVREGLVYVNIVEESLNVTDDHVNIRNEAETLWKKIDVDDANSREWLGNKLKDPSFKEKTAGQIVEWFRDTSKDIDESDEGGKDDPIHRSICANSMYHITKTILRTYHANTDVEVSRRELFNNLSSMIADIIAACLTNLQQVITMKCNASAIEKREDSVKDAAILLGETKEIIKVIKELDSKIPVMEPDDLPFINKWRYHLGSA